MMKRNYKILSLVLLLAFASCSFTSKTFSNPDKDKLLVQVITFVLEQGHFDPIALDDKFSAELFKDYVQIIDPVKRYFYESDIKDFEKFKTNIDDQLKISDITLILQSKFSISLLATVWVFIPLLFWIQRSNPIELNNAVSK